MGLSEVPDSPEMGRRFPPKSQADLTPNYHADLSEMGIMFAYFHQDMVQRQNQKNKSTRTDSTRNEFFTFLTDIDNFLLHYRD